MMMVMTMIVGCKIGFEIRFLNRLGVAHECDMQTDGRTDRTAVSNSAV